MNKSWKALTHPIGRIIEPEDKKYAEYHKRGYELRFKKKKTLNKGLRPKA